MIEAVEELRSELDAVPFVLTEFGVLENSEVEVFHAIGADVGFGARIVAVTEVRPVAEYGSVKPVGKPVVERTRSVM